MTDKTNNKPNRQELRKFGLLFALMLTVLFGVLLPFLRYGPAMGWPMMDGLGPQWPWMAATAIAAWALIHPRSLHLLHGPWMKFARVAQWVNTRIILMILFYVIILPIGLLLRLFGKDSMHRKFESKVGSYRVAADPRDNKHMEEPF